MKTDALTVAAAVFLIGLLISVLGLSEILDVDSQPLPALQQGLVKK